jgi:hypothetical protein
MRSPAARKALAEKLQSWPAPVGGWIANTSLATPGARLPDGRKVNGAARLENGFPTATAVRMRGGSEKYATVGNEDDDVVALFSYVSGNTEELFAADEVAIYDITSPADPEVSPAEAVGSLANDTSLCAVQFTTTGGTFLRVVNGANTPLVYDGATWGTSPAITGVTASNLSYVWAFKNRLFYIERDTLNAWYAGVGEIGGAVTKLPLGGVFTRGGNLVFGASWSLDENAGLSASCVFVTSEGEVAVYRGANPSDADDWALVGVYRIGKPRGPKAFIRAGGDLVIATDIGFVPLSQAIARDFAALAPSAVSYPIEDAWNTAVADRASGNWACEVWPAKQMVLVALHGDTDADGHMYVANARTGAWGDFTGWNGKAVHVFGDRCFYGSTEGRVIECEVTGADEGDPYTFVMVPQFDPLKSPASLKTGMMARVILRAPYSVTDRLSLQSDYTIDLPAAPDDTIAVGNNVWGTARWGEGTWGTEPDKRTFKNWRPVNGSGEALSVACQITSGGVSPPAVDLIQTDLTYEVGEVGS